MLECEGFKMFRGTMLITPNTPYKPFEISGDWLYKPEFKYWYCKGNSYPESACNIVEDLTK